MPDIAQLGFRADSQDLVDAKNRMDALGPAAGRAERSAAILEKIFGKLDGTADKLIKAITGLQGSVDKSTATYEKNATAAQRAASANDVMSMAAGKVSVTFNGVTSAATKVVTGTEKVTKTAQAATGAINAEAEAVKKLASANDNLASKPLGTVAPTTVQPVVKPAVQEVIKPVAKGNISVPSTVNSTKDINAQATATSNLTKRTDDLLNAIFPLSAVQAKINAMMNEAAFLYQKGALSATEYAGVQATLAQRAQLASSAQDKMNQAVLNSEGAAKKSNAAVGQLLQNILQFIPGSSGLVNAFQVLGSISEITGKSGTAAEDAAKGGGSLADSYKDVKEKVGEAVPVIQSASAATVASGGAAKAATGAFRTLGAAVYTAIAPLLPLLTGVAVVAGTIGAGFALGTRDINKGTDDLSKAMGLTEKQLERVKKSGVDTSVTIGDTFKATFQVLESRMSGLFDGPLKDVKKAWNSAMDENATSTANAVKTIVGTFVGSYYAIVALWKTMPKTFSGIGALVANAFISVFETLINRILDQVNGINDKINGALKAVGLDFQLVKLPSIKIDRVANKEAEDAGAAVSAGFAKGMAVGAKATDRFFADVRKKAISNRKALIKDAAGDAAKTPKDRGKSDAEKFQDIVNGAQRDIATTQAEINGINLTADAALRLKNEQKLLNEAQQKGLTLTPVQRAQLMALAGTLTDLQVKLKNLTGFKEIAKGAEENLAQLIALRGGLDLTGQAALTYTYKMDLVAQARAKGLTVGEKELAQFDRMAAALGKVAQANANLKYFIDARNSASEALDNSKAELATLGMSTEAASNYMYAQKLANDEKYRGITLSASQRAELLAANSAQSALTARINQTREAMDFARDSAKGFVTDLTTGLKQGENVFKTFGNAVLNVLDKVLNKLTDVALDAAMGGGSGGSAGGFFSSLLGSLGIGGSKAGPITGSSVTSLTDARNQIGAPSTFGGDIPSIKFAKGAGFSNGIVDSPTAFMFGKGGANLGIMGEKNPEAVMPLQRGPDGSLGVQMYGGGGGGMTIHAPISIANDNRVTGAVSSDDIVEMQRKSAENVKRELARELPEIINQFQRDGTYSG